MSAERLRERAETAEGAWGTDWYVEICPPDVDGGIYGVYDREVGQVTGGCCEEVADFIAAANPAVVRVVLDERDKFRKHSIILNSVAWRISEALGKVGPDDTAIDGDVQADLEELIGQLDACSWPAGSKGEQ